VDKPDDMPAPTSRHDEKCMARGPARRAQAPAVVARRVRMQVAI
jgi:hypothetical protein